MGPSDPAAPLVSIVVPCFNSADFVGEAIESALGQTHPECEIIVVDDGSSDGSWQAIQTFGSRVTAIRQENRGAPAARNLGLGQARGEYVQFLDADDVLFPEKIEACLRHFSAEVDVVFCGYVDEDAEARRGGLLRGLAYLAQSRPAPWDPDDVPASTLRTAVSTNAPLFRRAVLQKAGGWDESLRNNQDIELTFRLAVTGARFRRIDDVLVRVRQHAGVDRIRNRPDSHRGVLDAARAIREQAIAADALTPSVRRALADRFARYGRIAYQRSDLDVARAAFRSAYDLMHDPRPTAFPLYNAAARVLGLEPVERLARLLSLWPRQSRHESGTPAP